MAVVAEGGRRKPLRGIRSSNGEGRQLSINAQPVSPQQWSFVRYLLRRKQAKRACKLAISAPKWAIIVRA
jgi:hypothetical protein